MARKKTTEDLEWEHIFSFVSFDAEPPVKYIKDAVIKTKTGKRIRLTGKEFVSVMEQEKYIDPEQCIVESCRVTLDFEKLKDDINKFAYGLLKKSSSRYRKSRSQAAFNTQLQKMSTKIKEESVTAPKPKAKRPPKKPTV